jgi:hypothetical protein
MVALTWTAVSPCGGGGFGGGGFGGGGAATTEKVVDASLVLPTESVQVTTHGYSPIFFNVASLTNGFE